MYVFELVADDLCGTVTSLRRRRRWRALPCWDPRGGLAGVARVSRSSSSRTGSRAGADACSRVRARC